MKKISILAISLITINFGLLQAQTDHTQTDQRKMMVGVSSTLSLAGTGSDLMNLGYSITQNKSDAAGVEEYDPNKMANINLLPKVGYFIVDNLAIGLDLNIALSSTKHGELNYKFSKMLLSVGPFVRYYIPTKKVLPYFEIYGSFGSINYKSDYSENSYSEDSEHKDRIMSIGGGIGLAVPLGKRVTFDILAGYNHMIVKPIEDNDDNFRTVIGTLGLKIGFTIILGAN